MCSLLPDSLQWDGDRNSYILGDLRTAEESVPSFLECSSGDCVNREASYSAKHLSSRIAMLGWKVQGNIPEGCLT